MLPVEEKAMDTLTEILGHVDFPIERLKVMNLNWEPVEGDFFPVLHCEFYEENET